MSEETGSTAIDELVRDRDALKHAAEQALAHELWTRWRPWFDIPLLLLFIIAMTALFAPPRPGTIDVPELDSVVDSTIRARHDISIRDDSATALRREAALAVAPHHFDYDSDLYFELGEQVLSAVETMVERRDKAEKESDLNDPNHRRALFEADMGVSINAGTFALLEGLDDPMDTALAVNFFLNIALDRKVVNNRHTVSQASAIVILDTALDAGYRPARFAEIVDVKQVRRLMKARAGDAPYGSARIVRTWILQVATALARSNMRPNPQQDQLEADRLMATVKPVHVLIKSGEVLLRRGDRVTDDARAQIVMLNEALSTRAVWGETIAVGLLLSGVVLLASFFFRRGRVPLELGRKGVYLTLVIAAVSAIVCVGMIHAGAGLSEGMDLDASAAAYFVPVALATVLTTLLIDSRTSLLTGIGLTLLVAHRVGGDIWLVTYFFAGVLVGGIAARQCRRRTDLLRVGLAVALVQSAVLPIGVTLSGQSFGTEHVPFVIAALSSGIFVAIAALGLLPLLEYVFDEATDMRLLELASTDHPLLRRLALHAPGTYYASIMVGTLAEAAADAIGANGLKCRVMALYHDIGKLQRPGYFVENQHEGNIHERLAPELSARIVFAHVKDGIEIALKQRLGRPVVEAITQHQGTALLRMFYLKSLEQAKLAGTGRDVAGLEHYFRYPGPKPTSREAGILLLADSVEAATRALKNPRPADVQLKVTKIVEEKVSDGQLDDCILTLKDLAKIEAAFSRVLTLGVYHNRIEYPPLPSAVERPAKNYAGRHRNIGSISRLADSSQ